MAAMYASYFIHVAHTPLQVSLGTTTFLSQKPNFHRIQPVSIEHTRSTL